MLKKTITAKLRTESLLEDEELNRIIADALIKQGELIELFTNLRELNQKPPANGFQPRVSLGY